MTLLIGVIADADDKDDKHDAGDVNDGWKYVHLVGRSGVGGVRGERGDAKLSWKEICLHLDLCLSWKIWGGELFFGISQSACELSDDFTYEKPSPSSGTYQAILLGNTMYQQREWPNPAHCNPPLQAQLDEGWTGPSDDEDDDEDDSDDDDEDDQDDDDGDDDDDRDDRDDAGGETWEKDVCSWPSTPSELFPELRFEEWSPSPSPLEFQISKNFRVHIWRATLDIIVIISEFKM